MILLNNCTFTASAYHTQNNAKKVLNLFPLYITADASDHRPQQATPQTTPELAKIPIRASPASFACICILSLRPTATLWCMTVHANVLYLTQLQFHLQHLPGSGTRCILTKIPPQQPSATQKRGPSGPAKNLSDHRRPAGAIVSLN